jgi:hypothetical protein
MLEGSGSVSFSVPCTDGSVTLVGCVIILYICRLDVLPDVWGLVSGPGVQEGGGGGAHC